MREPFSGGRFGEPSTVQSRGGTHARRATENDDDGPGSAGGGVRGVGGGGFRSRRGGDGRRGIIPRATNGKKIVGFCLFTLIAERKRLYIYVLDSSLAWSSSATVSLLRLTCGHDKRAAGASNEKDEY
jgi:hypothetical protein